MNHKNENFTKITNKKGFFELNKNYCLQINLGEQLEESVNEIHRYRTNVRISKNLQKPSSDFELIHINSSSSIVDDDYYESFLNKIQRESSELKSQSQKFQTQKAKNESKLILDKLKVTSIVKPKIPQSTKNENSFLNNRKKNMLTQLYSIHEEKLSHPSSAVIEYRNDLLNREEKKHLSLFNEQKQKKNVPTFLVKKEESFSIEKPKPPHNEELRKSNESIQQVNLMKNSVNVSKSKKLGQSLFLSNCSNDNINHIKKFSVSPINLSRNSKEQIFQRISIHRKGKKSSSDMKLNNNIDNINKPICTVETSNFLNLPKKQKKKTIFCCIPIT